MVILQDHFDVPSMVFFSACSRLSIWVSASTPKVILLTRVYVRRTRHQMDHNQPGHYSKHHNDKPRTNRQKLQLLGLIKYTQQTYRQGFSRHHSYRTFSLIDTSSLINY